MIPVFRKKRGVSGASVPGLPVATLIHTMNGTFSITFRGINGAVIFCDPGDGSPVQSKTLLGASTDVTFSYANDGTERTVRLFGALGSIYRMNFPQMYVSSDVPSIYNGMSSLQRTEAYGTVGGTQFITGDVCSIKSDDINFLYLNYNNLSGDLTDCLIRWTGITSLLLSFAGSLTCSLGTWVCTSMVTLGLQSCFSSAEHVGNVLINAAGVQTTGSVFLTGSCPAPPATPEVTAAIAELTGDGVTVFVN